MPVSPAPPGTTRRQAGGQWGTAADCLADRGHVASAAKCPAAWQCGTRLREGRGASAGEERNCQFAPLPSTPKRMAVTACAGPPGARKPGGQLCPRGRNPTIARAGRRPRPMRAAARHAGPHKRHAFCRGGQECRAGAPRLGRGRPVGNRMVSADVGRNGMPKLAFRGAQARRRRRANPAA